MVPAKRLEFLGMPLISLNMAFEFYLPVICIGRWRGSDFASRMPMPKAPANFNNCFILGQDDVRMPRQSFYVKTETETIFMEI
jgi:hypothetical protein